MGLRSYVIRRLVLTIPVLFGVVVFIFSILQFLPPIMRTAVYITDPKTARYWRVIAEENGFFDPIYVQFLHWMKNLLIDHNLGIDAQGEPVFSAIMKRLPATLEIVVYGTPLIILLGLTLGVRAGANKDKPVDQSSRILTILATSLPSFWFGIVLLSVFYAGLGWFPPQRYGQEVMKFITAPSTTWQWYTGLMTVDSLLNREWWIFIDSVRHLVLPIATLGLLNSAVLVRVVRSSMLEALGKDYITAAKVKGLNEKEVINTHARRNALIPAITISGMMIAGLLTGVTITETVFNMEGVGQYAAVAAHSLDMPPVIGYALLSAVLFVIANLIVDILYAYVDPRIRLE